MFRYLHPIVLGVIALAVMGNSVCACHQEDIVGERCPLVAIAPDTGRVYVVYQNIHLHVVCKYSDDGGETWTGPITVTDSGFAVRPALTVDDAGGVYVAWYKDLAESDISEIWWSYSLDYGESWFAEGMVSTPEEFSNNPELAVDRGESDNIIVKLLYSSHEGTAKTLIYRWTTDLGAAWSEAVSIHSITKGRFVIKIDPAGDRSNARVAFLEGDVYYTSETDVPGVFEEPVNVSRNDPGFTSAQLAMALPRVRERYMVWHSRSQECEGSELLRMSFSDDFGETWTTPSDIRSNDGHAYPFPKLIALRAGPQKADLYVVAVQNPDQRVAFVKSLDSGQTWTEPIDICPADADRCANPILAAGAQNLLVVTMMASPPDREDVSHIYITKSTNGGSSWSEPVQLTGLGSLIPFDANGDNDVDLADVAAFQTCFTGDCDNTPCDPPLYAAISANCQSADIDDDGDVDWDDFEVLPELFAGPK